MKSILIMTATIIASCAEMYFLGINGLTILTVPFTIFLGIHTIEKVTEPEEQQPSK